MLTNRNKKWYAVLTKETKRLLFIAYWDNSVMEVIEFYTNYEDRQSTVSGSRGIIILQCSAKPHRK